MIISDVDSLNLILSKRKNIRSSAVSNVQDPEITKLFASSPPMSEISATFEFDSLFKARAQPSANLPQERSENDSRTNSSAHELYLGSAVVSEKFKAVPIEAPKRSALTEMLAANSSSSGSASQITLTIYLPDYSSMDVVVNEADNFDDVIRKTLAQHKEESRRPELCYHCPELYELRMHEGKPLILCFS